jgi:hypothetical protein
MTESIEVQGIIGGNPVEPEALVQIRFMRDGETIAMGQFSPDEARTHAQLVVEAASNATYEAAMFQWLVEEMGIPHARAAQAIEAMRIWRADKWGQPTIPEDWRGGR